MQQWQAVFLSTVALSFAIYTRTAYRSVPPGDSGELILAAHHLGVPHPPGYPLFAMLAHLAIRVLGIVFPSSFVAWRVNMLNAAFASVAAGLISLASMEVTGDSVPLSIGSAMAFALSPLVWQYACTAEVFSLNNLFVALLVLLSLVMHRLVASGASSTRVRATVVLTAFVSGLSLTNQHTALLFVLPLALGWVPWLLLLLPLQQPSSRFGRPTRPAKLLTPLLALQSILAFAAGMSPYAFLYIRSWQFPRYTWGDARTWAGFLHHFLRKEYGTFDLSPIDSSGDRVWDRLRDGLSLYLSDLLWTQFRLAWIALAVGLLLLLLMLPLRQRHSHLQNRGETTASASASASAVMPSTSWPPLVFLCASYCFYLGFFHWRANLSLHNPLYRGVSARFWQQPNILFAVLTAAAVHQLLRCCCRRWQAFAAKSRNVLSFAAAAAMVALFAWVAAWPASLSQQLAHGPLFLDFSENMYTHSFGMEILSSLPRDAVLLTRGDLFVNSVRYLVGCENIRPDVAVVDQELLTYPWYLRMHRHQFLDEHGLVFPGDFYHVRPVAHVDAAPDSRPLAFFTMRQFLDANLFFRTSDSRKKRKLSMRPIFVAGGWKSGDGSHFGSYTLVPHGLVHRVVPLAGEGSLSAIMPMLLDELTMATSPSGSLSLAVYGRSSSLEDHVLRALTEYPSDSWERVIGNDLLEARMRRAIFLLETLSAASGPLSVAAKGALTRPRMNRMVSVALEDMLEYERLAVHLSQTDKAFVHKNLGIAYGEMLRLHPDNVAVLLEAIRRYEMYLRLLAPVAADAAAAGAGANSKDSAWAEADLLAVKAAVRDLRTMLRTLTEDE